MLLFAPLALAPGPLAPAPPRPANPVEVKQRYGVGDTGEQILWFFLLLLETVTQQLLRNDYLR